MTDVLNTKLPTGQSLGLGLAVAGLVYGIYTHALPPVVDHRAAPPNDQDAQAAERLAAWTSAAVVSGVSLITKNETIFVMGGMMIIALSWWHRHADMVLPSTGKATGSAAMAATAQQSDAAVGAAYTTDY